MRIVLCALLLVASFAAAIPSDGNQPTETSNVLRVWYEENQDLWMSTAGSEPRAAEAGGWGTGSPTNSFSWTVPFAPELYYDMELDTGTDTKFSLVLGSSSAERAGAFTVTATLTADGTTVAAGTSDTETFGGGSYARVDIEVNGAFQGIFLRHGDANQLSTITLPVVGGKELLPDPPAPVLEPQFEGVAAASLALDFNYAEAATQVWTYNWTNANPVGNLTVVADVAAGSVNFVMIDDLNDTLLDATLEATYEQNQTFEGFEGNWTIRVTFTNFVGNATMRVMPDLPPVIPNPLAGPPNETFEGGNADDGSNDTPNVPILLALLGLAFVAMRRRA
jgi:hypothetical protein